MRFQWRGCGEILFRRFVEKLKKFCKVNLREGKFYIENLGVERINDWRINRMKDLLVVMKLEICRSTYSCKIF